MVLPQNTEQVAAVVRWCNETKTPLTPQGGNTSYRAGSVPDTSGDGIVLAMGRMNSLPVINREARLMTAFGRMFITTLQEEAFGSGVILFHLLSVRKEVVKSAVIYPLTLADYNFCVMVVRENCVWV
ncbi:MAG: FAD-binding oxidoreductase [Gammaproteobacteria bacterium WSBS_2016_MAG_OTU1]